MNNFTIRPIAAGDNETIAGIIRNTLVEFGANHPGTVYFDPTTDNLFELFRTEKSAYWIVKDEEGIVGGGGIFPTKGLPEGTCELVKLYLLPRSRGKGMGKALIEKCHKAAKGSSCGDEKRGDMPDREVFEHAESLIGLL